MMSGRRSRSRDSSRDLVQIIRGKDLYHPAHPGDREREDLEIREEDLQPAERVQGADAHGRENPTNLNGY